jgi:hypothetical protein
VSFSWVGTGRLTNYNWNQLRWQNTQRRFPVFVVLAGVFLLSTAWVCCRVREPGKLLVAGLLQMFALFAVSSYYYAVLILLATLALSRLVHAVMLLGMFLVGQVLYQQTWAELEYPLYSAILMVVLTISWPLSYWIPHIPAANANRRSFIVASRTSLERAWQVRSRSAATNSQFLTGRCSARYLMPRAGPNGSL